MTLQVENVGKLKKVKLEFNGITVICGDNNTGKSSVGKIIHLIYSTCYKINEKIDRQVCNSILIEIFDIIRRSSDISKNIDPVELGYNPSMIWKGIINNNKLMIPFSEIVSESSDRYELVRNFLRENLRDNFLFVVDNDELVEDIYQAIVRLYATPREQYKRSRINRFFNDGFEGQLISFNKNEASITVDIKGKKFNALFNDDGLASYDLEFDFTNKSILIDDPDSYYDDNYWKGSNSGFRNTLASIANKSLKKLSSDTEDIDQTKIDNNLSVINQVIGMAIPGKYVGGKSNRAGFQFSSTDSPVNINNLSTGVKSLLLFRTLCENGIFLQRDFLILDEPEIHLHPDWQLKYAEAIVLLQKEMDLTVLITTHSPYFVEALDYYTKKYDKIKETNFYLADNDKEGFSIIEDVTGSLNQIYKKMYRPLQKMMEEN